MDVFHMTYVRNATFHKLKKQQKTPCFMFRTIFAKFRYMNHEPLQKKITKILEKKPVKNRLIIAIISIISGDSGFKI